jgi:hypothetical protein
MERGNGQGDSVLTSFGVVLVPCPFGFLLKALAPFSSLPPSLALHMFALGGIPYRMKGIQIDFPYRIKIELAAFYLVYQRLFEYQMCSAPNLSS